MIERRMPFRGAVNDSVNRKRMNRVAAGLMSRPTRIFLLGGFLAGLAGCAQTTEPAPMGFNSGPSISDAMVSDAPTRARAAATVEHVTPTVHRGRVPLRRGYRKVGNPYQIKGRWYHPKQDESYDQVGTASWYGPQFHGKKTANGEVFDMNLLTAAHPTLPIPSLARVTNLANGKSVIVRINDRGPYAHNRLIDLSKRTAEALGFHHHGTAKVRVTYVGPAKLDPTHGVDGRIEYRPSKHANEADLRTTRTASATAENPLLIRASLTTPAAAPAHSRTAHNAPSQSPWAETVGRGVIARRADAQAIGATSSGGRYLVVAGTFSDPANAQRAATNLNGAGPVQIARVQRGSGVLHRVEVGPFIERDGAERAQRRAVLAGLRDARLTVTR